MPDRADTLEVIGLNMLALPLYSRFFAVKYYFPP
jgi:hypothetical protein